MMNSNNTGRGFDFSSAAAAYSSQASSSQSPRALYFGGSTHSPALGPDSDAYNPTQAAAVAATHHQLLMVANLAQQQAMRQLAAGNNSNSHNNDNGNFYFAAPSAATATTRQAPHGFSNLNSSLSGSNNGAAFTGMELFTENYQSNTHNLPRSSRCPKSPGAASALILTNRDHLHQRQQEQSSHRRQSSLDELLFMHPGIMAGLPIDSFPLTNVFSSSANAPRPDLASSLSSNMMSLFQNQENNNNNNLFEESLEKIQLEVSSISLEKMSGNEVIARVRERVNDVLTKYIPCVEFLVQCQQDLRKGVEYATQRRQAPYSRSRSTPNMTAKQFYTAYVEPLPKTFQRNNQFKMDHKSLNDAVEDLQKLLEDAKRNTQLGCEAVKSSFLGGMKEGKSWGLRKWLSKHGDALRVCTDLECILHACQKLSKDEHTTRRLAEILRPLAKRVLDRLRSDIPVSYQQHSTAHPYLPFFHRLEAALRSVSNFDPDDDDVICVDSDDDDEVVVEEVKSSSKMTSTPAVQRNPSPAKKRKRHESAVEIDDEPEPKIRPETERQKTSFKNDIGDDDDSSSGESDSEDIIQIIDLAAETNDFTSGEWTCASCSMMNAAMCSNCLACGKEKELAQIPAMDDFGLQSRSNSPASFCSSNLLTLNGYSSCDENLNVSKREPLWPAPRDSLTSQQQIANSIADTLDRLSDMFEQHQQSSFRPQNVRCSSFWDDFRYASAIRLFGQVLRRNEAVCFLDPVDEDSLIRAGNTPYSHIIKHPLCFRDIATALLGKDLKISRGNSGRLPVNGLSSWNMWDGSHLLQAIDLVFLNSLAYGKATDPGKSSQRSLTNKLRKDYWTGVHECVGKHVMEDSERRKRCCPTRRSESSGFVVYKIHEN
jgi:hypothetical protein